MDFNEVLTKSINEQIQKQIDKDFARLKEEFDAFVRKYCVLPGCEPDWEKSKEATLKALRNGRFELYPKLHDHLFMLEASRVIKEALLNIHYDPDDTSIIPSDDRYCPKL